MGIPARYLSVKPGPRMTYDEVYKVIATYANEMLPLFADGWSRFPEGGNAATIVNYLNDRASFFYDINEPDTATTIVDAATEIIVRCG